MQSKYQKQRRDIRSRPHIVKKLQSFRKLLEPNVNHPSATEGKLVSKSHMDSKTISEPQGAFDPDP